MMFSRRSTRWLALGTLATLGACARPTTPAAPRRAATAVAAPTSTAGSDAYSVYELGSTWRDQDGASLTLDSLRGRPRVLAMIYTHCTSTCPLVIAELRRIAAGTDARLGLVLVSLDPDRDTPDALASYARGLGLDPARWTLLAGTDGDVRELAASLGVRYRRLSPDELAHSNTLTLLDATGRVVHQQQGLGERDETITAARALLP